jgi:hypothetical protein
MPPEAPVIKTVDMEAILSGSRSPDALVSGHTEVLFSLNSLPSMSAQSASQPRTQYIFREEFMVRGPRSDNEARLDELDNGRGETGADSAGQSGDLQELSRTADASGESVEELAEEDQALEAEIVEGVEDAADHPERPTHTHDEYGTAEDAPQPRKRSA